MKKPIIKYFLIAIACFCTVCKGQGIKNHKQILDKWTKATVNVMSYTKGKRDTLLLIDSIYNLHQIDSNAYHFWITQLIASGSCGTAVWVTYKEHNFLLSARHVLEDRSLIKGACYSDIHIIENDTLHSTDLKKIEVRPHRTYALEVGTPLGVIQVNNSKLYTFSSIDDDMAVVNIDSSGYAYGVLKFLKIKGYQPITIEDVDTVFKVKNNDEVIAIGYPAESTMKVKTGKELPNEFALATSPIFTIPVVSYGRVFDVMKDSHSFEVSIFTYHGFSGGPVVNTKGKLIGFTHGGPLIRKLTTQGSYYEYHGEFRKATLIMPLVRYVLKQVQSQQMQLRNYR